ncbi:MAG: GH95, partial [uncultured Chloroflexia bacterium]
ASAEQQIGYGLYASTGAPPRTLSFRQVLPFDVNGAAHPKDRAFRLSLHVNGDLERVSRMNWHGVVEQMPLLERRWLGKEPFLGLITFDHGLANALVDAYEEPPTVEAYADAAAILDEHWADYWARSGVALDDEMLERMWYHNLYFLNCAMRAGATCPGLFANWSYRKIGTAWHGDYHLNYNTQQPFWVTFSTNHVAQHLPYVDLVDHVMPISQKWAREYYGLRGAYFPHSAYPVEMTIMPYPVPTWGWEICETPWTVQSLWWHYLYTMDRTFLAERAFGPMREAVIFMVDYMRRPVAHGERWNDDRYHIFPTVVPELYGLTPGLTKNYDCLVDLTLTKFLFQAFLDASAAHGREEAEAELCNDVVEILEHFPPYATAQSPIGEVFVTVPGERGDTVYNVPAAAMTVFPGEEDGLHSDEERLARARNTYRNQRIEGGNELVIVNLQGARLGILDLERFKRDVAYCLLPNGTCTDMVQQVHGRYADSTNYDFMGAMG